MNIQLSKVVSQINDRFLLEGKKPRGEIDKIGWLVHVVSSAGVNFIDFNCCNYRKLSRQMLRQVAG